MNWTGGVLCGSALGGRALVQITSIAVVDPETDIEQIALITKENRKCSIFTVPFDYYVAEAASGASLLKLSYGIHDYFIDPSNKEAIQFFLKLGEQDPMNLGEIRTAFEESGMEYTIVGDPESSMSYTIETDTAYIGYLSGDYVMIYHTVTDPDDDTIWNQILLHQGESFQTFRGLPFSYHQKISRAMGLMAAEDCVAGPKKLGVFGASYLYPIFLQIGIIRKEPRMRCLSTLLSFEKLRNTRDLGGMKTMDGRVIVPDRLYRSGHLADLSENDIHLLSALVGTVIDLRTNGERAKQPDKEIPGTVNIHLPIVDDLTAGISREAQADQDIFKKLLLKPAEARAYMCDMYRTFTDNFAVSQYSRFLRALIQADGAVLWHCTAGKDRAGIACVIVEEILGVAREDIVADYLKTNDYLEQDIRFLIGYVKKQAASDSQLANQALRYLLGADEAYIRAYYEAVDQRFGGFDSFVRDGLKMSDEDTAAIRQKYLE